MTTPSKTAAVGLLTLAALPAAAHAHPGHDPIGGFWSGFTHPLTGLDHLAAIFAVGLWAGQRGERAVWVLPAVFVGVLIFGAALGRAGVALPAVESTVAASVLILGVIVVAAARLTLAAGAGIVGVFALFHGHAHGTDMPLLASAPAWAGGYLAATFALLLIGLSGRMLNASLRPVQFAGGAVAAYGLVLILS